MWIKHKALFVLDIPCYNFQWNNHNEKNVFEKYFRLTSLSIHFYFFNVYIYIHKYILYLYVTLFIYTYIYIYIYIICYLYIYLNWWIVFVVWLTDESRLALFPAGSIVRDPHHRESLTHRQQVWTCAESEFRLS